ncbi:MAG: hypothetical protein KBT27_14745 [Prevotellaceae bacterium]|nr:hypothetical protein [Candidatus Faecinaster equi]
MASKIKQTECIEYLNNLLAFKGNRYLSDQDIHRGLCNQYLNYARFLWKKEKAETMWELTSKALEHIRLSYTSSRESGEECVLECCVPDGYNSLLELYSDNPGYPYLIEADVWLEKARICMKRKDWIAAYGCIQHAENFCKVTTRKNYDNILDGIPECYPDDCIQDCPERIIYEEIKRERKEIMDHVDVTLFNQNTPSDDFLIQYTWSFTIDEDVKLIVAHWQDMISRHDFHIFSEQQCYMILLEFYLFYWFLLNFEEKEQLSKIILECIDRAIWASPVNTAPKEDTVLNPWIIHTDDGRIISAYRKPKSVENMEVHYWMLRSELYRFPFYGKERESVFSEMHARFLDRIYFFDTKEYALNDEYFTPECLARMYREKMNNKTSLDLVVCAKELLEINPAAKLNDFVEFIQMKVDVEGDEL